jgi:vitamin K-dependent gamma-carboxylase
MPTPTELVRRARSALEQPVDPAGLAAFRILFGLTMALATFRFVLNGWVDELLVMPPYHFTYLGFDWVKPLSQSAMHALFAVMGVAALAVSVGFFTRVSAAVFCVLFTYAELIDKATYLNHYYLASLLALLLVVVPSGATWSVDAWLLARRGKPANLLAPALSYWLLRAQVGVVYVFAGLAKLDGDWLVRAEPIKTWLRARVEAPFLVGLAPEPWAPYAMSYAGAVFDLAVVPLLLLRKTRAFAFAAALAFHLCIWALFPVGVFSFVMLVAISVFFAPDWPRRFAGRVVRLAPFTPGGPLAKPRAWVLSIAAAYVVVQLLVPLRFALYPGAVNWTEQGFRFAWRVMLVEKSGQVEYDVVTESPRGRFHVYPRSELTPLQLRQMATQPDMIADYARHLRQSYEARGYRNVRVFADAWVSFNGRRSQRLVDPEVDLAAAPRSFAPKPWILPLDAPRTPSRVARH